jgi:hypothetical protein
LTARAKYARKTERTLRSESVLRFSVVSYLVAALDDTGKQQLDDDLVEPAKVMHPHLDRSRCAPSIWKRSQRAAAQIESPRVRGGFP